MNEQRMETGATPILRAALAAAQEMGYELHVPQAELNVSSAGLSVAVTLTNRGVAPFYYTWPVELGVMDANGNLRIVWTPRDWNLTTIQPDAPAAAWRSSHATSDAAPGEYRVAMRVANPLLNGKPLRFANETQDRNLPGWLTLGRVRLE